MNEIVVDFKGDKIWYETQTGNIYLREEGWFSYPTGDFEYFSIRCHRADGPALISSDGSEFYYIHGQRHCEDGPASIWYNGSIQWFLNDSEYSFEKWCKKLNKSEEEINFLKLKCNI